MILNNVDPSVIKAVRELKQMESENKRMDEAKKLVEHILRTCGIEMSVNACGCCGSPWVTFKYHGETILDDCDDVIIDTTRKEGEL